jgi:hypothetical protein
MTGAAGHMATARHDRQGSQSWPERDNGAREPVSSTCPASYFIVLTAHRLSCRAVTLLHFRVVAPLVTDFDIHAHVRDCHYVDSSLDSRVWARYAAKGQEL